MKPMDFAYRKESSKDKGLPNLRKWGKFDHGLKRTKRIYLHGHESDIITRSLFTPPSNEQPMGLPGITSKPKRKPRGTICVHNNNLLCESSSSVTVLDSGTASSSSSYNLNSGRDTGGQIGLKSAGGESPFSGNSSSAAGSGSWTSGNGNTSPRRRIRVQTPIARSSGSRNNNSDKSKPSSLQHNPRPPSKPRNTSKNSQSQRKNSISFGSDESPIRSCEGDEVGDERRTPFRPHTPALGKSRHFKATLQNIQEVCPPKTASKSDRSNIKMKVTTNNSSRRRSVGSLANTHDVDDNDNGSPLQLRYGRRRSMPIDLHEVKRQIDSIRFINIREFSREYIQDILSRRDKQATKGIDGEERRQNKCLSWLQSLEGAL